jgi:hypothetical protein
MLQLFSRFLLFMDMVVNYGIKPSTILKNREVLQYARIHKSEEGKDKHGV